MCVLQRFLGDENVLPTHMSEADTKIGFNVFPKKSQGLI